MSTTSVKECRRCRQTAVVDYLRRRGSSTAADIAAALGCSLPAVTAALGALRRQARVDCSGIAGGGYPPRLWTLAIRLSPVVIDRGAGVTAADLAWQQYWRDHAAARRQRRVWA